MFVTRLDGMSSRFPGQGFNTVQQAQEHFHNELDNLLVSKAALNAVNKKNRMITLLCLT